jgi:phasin protein
LEPGPIVKALDEGKDIALDPERAAQGPDRKKAGFGLFERLGFRAARFSGGSTMDGSIGTAVLLNGGRSDSRAMLGSSRKLPGQMCQSSGGADHCLRPARDQLFDTRTCRRPAVVEKNLKAAFEHARKLISAKDINEVMQMQTEFLRNQFGVVTEQSKQTSGASRKKSLT